MNLAHGLGVEAMRSERADLLIGNIYNFHPREPASGREQDEMAAAMLDALWNRSFPDPQIHGSYPEPLAAEMEALGQPGDLEIIKQKPDYFAFNHYTRTRVRHDPDHPFEAGTVPPEPGTPVTEMGWEIAPDAFLQVMIEAKIVEVSLSKTFLFGIDWNLIIAIGLPMVPRVARVVRSSALAPSAAAETNNCV